MPRTNMPRGAELIHGVREQASVPHRTICGRYVANEWWTDGGIPVTCPTCLAPGGELRCSRCGEATPASADRRSWGCTTPGCGGRYDAPGALGVRQQKPITVGVVEQAPPPPTRATAELDAVAEYLITLVRLDRCSTIRRVAPGELVIDFRGAAYRVVVSSVA